MSEHEREGPTGERDEDAAPDEHGEYGEHGDPVDPVELEGGSTYCAYTDYTQDGPGVESLPATGEGATGLERRVWDALYGIDDPEMPVSIVDLGLIYRVTVEPDGGTDTDSTGETDAVDEVNEADVTDEADVVDVPDAGSIDGGDGSNGTARSAQRGSSEDVPGAHVTVDMTLTYTGCPARKMLLEEVEAAVRRVEGIERVDLELVWSPNWSLEMVTEQGRRDLREFGLSVPEPEEAV